MNDLPMDASFPKQSQLIVALLNNCNGHLQKVINKGHGRRESEYN